ncbi:uncharacterized protein LOC120897043 [Anopheles arabiensis]|uniref:uncharacterized protein LOC120897043 n=1 Tax=Anopheles arabiensis TaxID=7173 RepID=UPI001AAC4E40|nr:uncharacterized protein LOC120897043 [Anopheles arabiensis]
MLAKSLIKTYPILASNVSDVPYAAWFHKGGRGAGRHAGSIHYRMETLAKRSCSRVFYRSRHDEATPSSSKIITNDECGENIDDLVYELETIVPLENSMENIKYLWKQTLAYRHEKRARGIFSQFMTDCSAASAFGGELISLEFELMNPTAAKFEDMWNVIQQKILEKFRIDYRYIKNDLIQSLCLVREKNTIRGAKRTREEDYKENDARTLNPLHGIIDGIDFETSFPTPDVPRIIIVAKMFELGECYVVWKNSTIHVGNNLIRAFIVLCQAFTVFNVKCYAADKLFFSFFHASCFKLGALSTTSNKFLNQLF